METFRVSLLTGFDRYTDPVVSRSYNSNFSQLNSLGTILEDLIWSILKVLSETVMS